MKNLPLYEARDIKDLKEMLNSSVELYGNNTAFLVKRKGIDNYSPISYKQFKDDVDALGTALISMGLKDSRIALIGENRYEWAVSYLAIANGTGIAVPLDKELPANELESLLARSKASTIIYSSNKESILDVFKRSESIKYFIDMNADTGKDNFFGFSQLLQKGRELIQNGNREFLDAKIDEKAMGFLLFTSGTTELSKAVMLTHSNIASNLKAMSSMLYIGDNDIFLSVLPLHHTYECTCGFLCPIYRGAAIAICEGLRHIPKNLQESKATVMLGVPLIFEAIYKRIWDQAAKKPELLKKLKLGLKISNLLRKVGINISRKLFATVHETFGGKIRVFISGAAGIDPVVAKGFRDLGLLFVQGYGLTECSPIVGLNRDVDFKDDAAGIPLKNLEVKIEDPNSEGIGEIVVKGPSVMIGYYENPEATSKVLKNGWFHTGDMGFIDKDGFIHITGRKKNVIVTKNGKNIYPEEIETLLNRSQFIKESMVYGKEETSGDVVVAAVIVPDAEKLVEVNKGIELSEKEINSIILNEIKTVNKELVGYKYIKDFKLRDEEFAKTTTKKIKRYMEGQA